MFVIAKSTAEGRMAGTQLSSRMAGTGSWTEALKRAPQDPCPHSDALGSGRKVSVMVDYLEIVSAFHLKDPHQNGDTCPCHVDKQTTQSLHCATGPNNDSRVVVAHIFVPIPLRQSSAVKFSRRGPMCPEKRGTYVKRPCCRLQQC